MFAPSGSQRMPSSAEAFNASAPTLSDLVRQFRPETEPTEAAVLQSLMYTLLGSPSHVFPSAKDFKSVSIPCTLPTGSAALVAQLVELGLLYRHLAQGPPARGQIPAAFFRSVQSGLEAGYVAKVNEIAVSVEINTVGYSEVSLTFVYSELSIFVPQLRFLWYLHTHVAHGEPAGRFLSRIYGFVSHGDPNICAEAGRVFRATCEPFFRMTEQWVLFGAVEDKIGEFFVQLNSISAPQIDYSRVPIFFSTEIAERIFQVGKTLIFLKTHSRDFQWAETFSARHSAEFSAILNGKSDVSATVSNIIRIVDSMYAELLGRVAFVLFRTFRMGQHLLGLKKYILMANGEFIEALLESSEILSLPASSVSAHHVTRVLESAKTVTTNSKEISEISSAVDARLLDLQTSAAALPAWEVFTLDYRLDGNPVKIVLELDTQKGYLKMFNMLWRFRRAEKGLRDLWQRDNSERKRSRGRGFCGARGARGARRTREAGQLAARMRGFLTAVLQYFFASIETAWSELVAALEAQEAQLGDDVAEAQVEALAAVGLQLGEVGGVSGVSGVSGKIEHQTLDAITSHHREYLHKIVESGLLADGLIGSFTGKEVKSEIFQILVLIESFLAVADGIREATIEEETAYRLRQELGTAESRSLAALDERLKTISRYFRKRMQYLVIDLSRGDGKGTEMDRKMKSLALALNMNGYY